MKKKSILHILNRTDLRFIRFELPHSSESKVRCKRAHFRHPKNNLLELVKTCHKAHEMSVKLSLISIVSKTHRYQMQASWNNLILSFCNINKYQRNLDCLSV